MDYVLHAETGFLGLELEQEQVQPIITTYDIETLLKNLRENKDAPEDS